MLKKKVKKLSKVKKPTVKKAKSTRAVLGRLEKGSNKTPEKISGNKVEDYVNFLRALASPERLNILEALETHEMCTSDVEHKFFMEQSTASHHLNTLQKANIVKCRKDGRRVFYRVNEDYMYKNYLGFMRSLEHTPRLKGDIHYDTR